MFCREALAGEVRACAACGAQVHADCAAELSRCPTLGCRGDWGEAVLSGLAPPPRPVPDKAADPGDDRDPLSQPALAGQADGRPARRRWGRYVAALLGLTLLGGWLSTFLRAPGQVAELGGWFSGHGRTPAAVLGTFGAGYRRPFGSSSVKSVAFSLDGARLASLDRDRQLIEWDWETGAIVRELELTQDATGSASWVGYAPDASTLWALVWTRAFRIEGLTVAEIEMLPQPERDMKGPSVVAAWAGRQGRLRVAFAGESELRVTALAPASGDDAQVLLRAAGDGVLQNAAISLGGERVAACWEGAVGVWDLTTGRGTHRPVSGFVYAVAFHPQGEVLAYLLDTRIVLWDFLGDRVVREIALEGDDYGYDLAYAPHGDALAVYGAGTTIYSEGGRLAHFPHHHRLTYGLAWSPDGAVLATGGKDQVVRVWRAPE